jgi:hypothetical protein
VAFELLKCSRPFANDSDGGAAAHTLRLFLGVAARRPPPQVDAVSDRAPRRTRRIELWRVCRGVWHASTTRMA